MVVVMYMYGVIKEKWKNKIRIEWKREREKKLKS